MLVKANTGRDNEGGFQFDKDALARLYRFFDEVGSTHDSCILVVQGDDPYAPRHHFDEVVDPVPPRALIRVVS